eukprot:CAMPEP_0196821476 /NCGR_PEP_ID=MMETSP1362-20130617/79354_1 /TAXON_ID=163516 /ORGANISM="Leptocylindrus danicus, Strain CCMP1856" /LENGTH=363 /DNA_ID=CAMNT_0042200669 /DNA_START=58 /DNA_END=1146 /DNA_ORIENTATION=-
MHDQPQITLRGHGASSVSSLCFLRKNLLVSCDSSEQGCLLLWNLDSRKLVAKLYSGDESDDSSSERRSSIHNGGLFIDRFSTCEDKFVYQQRNGMSVYDIETMKTVSFFETDSTGFCQATTCDNLVIYPHKSSSFKIWDHRCDPSTTMIFSAFRAETDEKHGMLCSLSANICGNNLAVACGMESGNIFCHYFSSSAVLTTVTASSMNSLSVGTDPVLCMDLIVSSGDDESSCVGVAGLAGDALEIAQKSRPEDRGTIVTFKVKATCIGDQNKPTLKLRQRMSTCEVGGTAAGGKPGVACCRFRKDGRIFATGGWDRRVRVFSRSGRSLAILKGSKESVTSLDWNPWIQQMMATGSADGRISLW